MKKILLGILSLFVFVTFAQADVTKGLIGKEDLRFYDGITNTFTRPTSTGGTASYTKIAFDSIDVLRVFGDGSTKTQAAINTAITQIGTSKYANLYLSHGTWTLASDVDLSSTNLTITLDKGAVLAGAGRLILQDGQKHYVSWRRDFEDSIADIGSIPATLVIDQDIDIEVNNTVPATLVIEPIKGNLIDGAFTLTINSNFNPGTFQTFGSSVTVAGLRKANPLWWGDNTTHGTTDMTTEIQAAIDSLVERSILELSPGAYLLSATLTVDDDRIVIKGAGTREGTTFYRTTDYGDTIEFTGVDATGVYLYFAGISDIQFWSAGAMTSGEHIKANGVQHLSITNISMLNGFSGLGLYGVQDAFLDNVYITFENLYGSAVTTQAYMKVGDASTNYATNYCGDIFLSNFNFRGVIGSEPVLHGIEIVSGDGLWFSNGHVGNTTTANLMLNASSSNIMSLVFFDNVMFDEGTGVSAHFKGSTATARNIYLENSELKGGASGTYGVLIDAAADFKNVHFSNYSISEFSINGIKCNSEDAQNWSFIGVDVRGNGTAGAATYNAVDLAEGKKWQFVGGAIGGSGIAPYTTHHKYGIQTSATFEDLILSGVDLSSNVTGSYNFIGASALQVEISGCITDVEGEFKKAVAVYDFADDGGAVSDITIAILPDNATIVNAWYEVVTALTSDGNADIAISTSQVANEIATAADYDWSTFSAGFHDAIPDGNATNFTTKTTASRNIIVSITTAALTAGKIYLYYEYIVSE